MTPYRFPIVTPLALKAMYPTCVWEMPPQPQPTLYLTFDDGPVPGATEYILDVLQEFQAKGTFFCVGANVMRHPSIFSRILDAGHMVGNHTQNHVDAWQTLPWDYWHEVQSADHAIRFHTYRRPYWFRPPFGHLTHLHLPVVQPAHGIAMWSVSAGDMQATTTAEDCFRNVADNAFNGCIVAMHDNPKSDEKTRGYLPRLLEHLHQMNYTFAELPEPTKPLGL